MFLRRTLLLRGYFPAEIPPAFTTKSLWQALYSITPAVPKGFVSGKIVSRPSRFNLARAGGVRRRLSIPNPVNYSQVASSIEKYSSDIRIVLNSSNISLSTPSMSSTRAYAPAHNLSDLTQRRVSSRIAKQYLVTTDIAGFYSSIYTHSIPWAMHSKAVAKANRAAGLAGNDLDTATRNMQDQQTKGIQVGPDSSLIIAEIILSSIDTNLVKKCRNLQGFRYVDDYEFSFSSRVEAENFLSDLQDHLSEYELELNTRKTRIDEIPQPVEKQWMSFIREFEFSNSGTKRQSRDIVSFFDRTFEIMREFPDMSVAPFALSKVRDEVISPSNTSMFNNYVLQSASAEPGALARSLAIFHDQLRTGRNVPLSSIEQLVNVHILRNRPLGNDTEVAWALWGALAFGVPIHSETVSVLKELADSITAILAIAAAKKGLMNVALDTSQFETVMNSDELYDEHWLLAYEALNQGWLSPNNGINYVASDINFNYLKMSGVSFYSGVDNSQRLELGATVKYN